MTSSLPLRFLVLALAAFALLGAAGCTPQIGDKCVLSTDCSTQGTLVCDPTQPGGYCTEVNCQGNLCPNQAACVLFNATLPGCAYNDKAGPMGARTSESFCMKQCHHDSDCRAGYECIDPRGAPWNGVIQDDDQTQHICIGIPDPPTPDASVDYDAAVCQAAGPPVPPLDASITYMPDASLVDAPPPDVEAPDASQDTGAGDASRDSGAGDTGARDSGSGDGGADSGAGEGGMDAGEGDGGAADASDAGG
jgi:hypothetical protein